MDSPRRSGRERKRSLKLQDMEVGSLWPKTANKRPAKGVVKKAKEESTGQRKTRKTQSTDATTYTAKKPIRNSPRKDTCRSDHSSRAHNTRSVAKETVKDSSPAGKTKHLGKGQAAKTDKDQATKSRESYSGLEEDLLGSEDDATATDAEGHQQNDEEDHSDDNKTIHTQEEEEEEEEEEEAIDDKNHSTDQCLIAAKETESSSSNISQSPSRSQHESSPDVSQSLTAEINSAADRPDERVKGNAYRLMASTAPSAVTSGKYKAQVITSSVSYLDSFQKFVAIHCNNKDNAVPGKKKAAHVDPCQTLPELGIPVQSTSAAKASHTGPVVADQGAKASHTGPVVADQGALSLDNNFQNVIMTLGQAKQRDVKEGDPGSAVRGMGLQQQQQQQQQEEEEEEEEEETLMDEGDNGQESSDGEPRSEGGGQRSPGGRLEQKDGPTLVGSSSEAAEDAGQSSAAGDSDASHTLATEDEGNSSEAAEDDHMSSEEATPVHGHSASFRIQEIEVELKEQLLQSYVSVLPARDSQRTAPGEAEQSISVIKTETNTPTLKSYTVAMGNIPATAADADNDDDNDASGENNAMVCGSDAGDGAYVHVMLMNADGEAVEAAPCVKVPITFLDAALAGSSTQQQEYESVEQSREGRTEGAASSVGGCSQSSARAKVCPQAKDTLLVMKEGLFACRLCTYSTSKKANWYKHKKKHEGRVYKCPNCSYKANTSSNLARHRLIHNQVKGYQCDLCSKRFRQKIHMDRHINYIHKEKQIACPLCNYRCSHYNPDLMLHIKRTHENQSARASRHRSSDGKHSRSSQKKGQTLPGTSLKDSVLTCDECGYTTENKKDMKQHLKFHRRGPEMKLFCSQCSFVTDCPSRLERHTLTHSGLKPFHCSMCDYKATQQVHILRHMTSRHSISINASKKRRMMLKGGMSSKCKQEEVLGPLPVITDKASLLMPATELNKKHYPLTDYCTQEKHFSCNFCTMKFTKLINLFKHVSLQHKDVLPQEDGVYNCVLCEYRTCYKKNLLVHLRKHGTGSPTTDYVPRSLYSCPICDFVRPVKLDLYAHMKLQHNMQLVSHKDGVFQYILEDSSPDVIGLVPGSMLLADDSPAKPLSLLDGSDPSMTHFSHESCILHEDETSSLNADSSATRTVFLQMDEDTPPMPVEIITASSSSDMDLSNSLPRNPVSSESPMLFNGDLPSVTALKQELNLENLTKESAATSTVTSSLLRPASAASMDPADSPEMEKEQGEQDVKSLDHVRKESSEESLTNLHMAAEQLVHLSSGDFIEINGEVYKVEMTEAEVAAAHRAKSSSFSGEL